jgi:hypothetical protein
MVGGRVLWLVCGLVLVGCGGHATAPVRRAAPAHDLVFLSRVTGPDPAVDEVHLRSGGDAVVRLLRGGAGARFEHVALPTAAFRRAARLVRAADLPDLPEAHATPTPGGFAYLIRIRGRSRNLADGHVPRRLRGLVALLNAIIDDELGHRTRSIAHH